MKSFLIPISSFKVSMASLIVALLALSQTSLEAVIIVDDDPDNYQVYHDNPDSDHNQAYFAYYNEKKSGDDNVSGTFLETTSSGNNEKVSAYNDGDGTAYTPNDNNSYTTLGEPLTLADAGIITYKSQQVVAFYLDANQSGKDNGELGNNYYDVSKLQIWFSQSETVSAPGGGTNAESAYSFDVEDNGGNTLRLFYGNGAANWDIALYVPASQFGITPDTNLSDIDLSNTYIQFHVVYTDTAGADTWAYDRGADIIPEPSSVLLVSLGGLMSLFRRRR
jgi:hypothetical protein